MGPVQLSKKSAALPVSSLSWNEPLVPLSLAVFSECQMGLSSRCHRRHLDKAVQGLADVAPER